AREPKKSEKRAPRPSPRIDGMTAPLHWAGMFLGERSPGVSFPGGDPAIIMFLVGRGAGPGCGCPAAIRCTYVGSCVGRRRRTANLLVISTVIRGVGIRIWREQARQMWPLSTSRGL